MVPRDGSGLRHLTHYRIVVAEVCLPSTEIKSSYQLMHIVLNCMIGMLSLSIFSCSPSKSLIPDVNQATGMLLSSAAFSTAM